MAKMDPKVKKAWIKELRSGKHKQCKGKLKRTSKINGDSFCCLGILQEKVLKIPCSQKGTVLRNDAIEKAGMSMRTEGDPHIGKYAASTWNDMKQKTFPEIADLIEKYL